MLRGFLRLEIGRDERRPDWPRRHAVDANLTGNQALRQRFRKRMDGALSRGIIEQLFVSFESGDRSSVDNRAARLQMRDGGLRHVEIAINVGAEGVIPLLFADLFEVFLAVLKSSVVHENVELTILLESFLNCTLAEVRVGDITRNKQALPAMLLDGVAGLFRIALRDLSVPGRVPQSHGFRLRQR